MVNRRSRKRTPSRVTRGGLTAIRIGKDDVFLFPGKKLKPGTIGVFGSNGRLRLGVFQPNRKKTRTKRRLTKSKKSSRSRKLTKRRRKSRSAKRSLK